MSLFFSYETNVDKAYIIRLYGNDVSTEMSARCAKSCSDVGQNWNYWSAYDGTGEEIQRTNQHASDVMDMLKVTDHYATKSEVATALSHISLWAHCLLIDKPIVILEHDAIMLRAYSKHKIFNSIAYLGSNEQKNQGWSVLPTPPHASEGPNYHFICRAHAYAIDPVVAKNMVAYVLQQGIYAPLDIMLRADIFPMHQPGLFAYDASDNERTTILGRPSHGRSTQRNDNLEF